MEQEHDPASGLADPDASGLADPDVSGLADPDVAAVLDWWTVNARDLPWRASRDIYAVWVAEVMSAQTTVIRSAGAWVRWMERWPTVEAVAAASLAQAPSERLLATDDRRVGRIPRTGASGSHRTHLAAWPDHADPLAEFHHRLTRAPWVAGDLDAA